MSLAKLIVWAGLSILAIVVISEILSEIPAIFQVLMDALG